MSENKKIVFLMGLILIISGCTGQIKPSEIFGTTNKPQSEQESDDLLITYNEAPLLSELVLAGKLPPVEERLPVNPVVIQPVERVGVYGGTWNMGMTGQNNTAILRTYVAYENLLRWDPEWKRIIPNLAQSYEVNDNSTEFVFHLREGLRWSDGEPFTADDILFWWYVVNLDNKIWPNVNKLFRPNDLPGNITKIDDFTIMIKFQEPYGSFLSILASVKTDYCLTVSPMHYLKQFHIDYNPEGIDALVAESGLENWIELYKKKRDRFRNPDIPTMNAWTLNTPYSSESETKQQFVTMKRNPYYWKIDTDLNQLPYIDQINFTIYPSKEALETAAIAGQIDAQHSLINIKENYEKYAENKESGEYELHTMLAEGSNALAIHLNLTHINSEYRQMFNNKNFRVALSLAINRSKIINRIYTIPLEPYQPAPKRESPYFREKLAKQYTDFNPNLANKLLDEAGYDQRDIKGYRLTADGLRIEFTITVPVRKGDDTLIAAEMVAENWHDVGIFVNVVALAKEEFNQLIYENLHDAVIESSPGGFDVKSEPGIYMPNNRFVSYFAILWADWYQNNGEGEKPPLPVLTQFALYDQLRATSDPDEIIFYMSEILTIAEEQFYVMGISQPPNNYMLVKTDFHNVPLFMPLAWVYPSPAPTNPSQYFIDQQK